VATAKGGFINAKLDERSYNRAIERLKKYEGQPFAQKMTKAHEAGGRMLVSPLRRAINSTITGHGKNPGMLASRVSMRKRKPSMGYIVRVGTKSRAPHAGLVARGHRIVTRGGRPTGGRSAARPFNSMVIGSYEGKVIDFIARSVAREGGGTLMGGITSF
jgi:hypothetical protein